MTFDALAPDTPAREILRMAAQKFGSERIMLATSFSVEDQVLTHMISVHEPRIRLFTLDTGRHFQETYDIQQLTEETYGVRIQSLVPDRDELEAYLAEHGPNAFFDSCDLRRECCAIRKTRPLKRVLSTMDAWICGLRQEQSPTRAGVRSVEWDESHQIHKINPLWNWSEERVWDYINAHRVPYNPLQKRGFRSLGCAPCTRPVKPGEDIRAGRWWWENPEHRECGIHRASSYAATLARKS